MESHIGPTSMRFSSRGAAFRLAALRRPLGAVAAVAAHARDILHASQRASALPAPGWTPAICRLGRWNAAQVGPWAYRRGPRVGGGERQEIATKSVCVRSPFPIPLPYSRLILSKEVGPAIPENFILKKVLRLKAPEFSAAIFRTSKLLRPGSPLCHAPSRQRRQR